MSFPPLTPMQKLVLKDKVFFPVFYGALVASAVLLVALVITASNKLS